MNGGIEARWLIRGRLVLTAPLRLATGEAEVREMPGAPDVEDGAAPANEISATVALVHRAADGRPMIPGSSLKGVLRHGVAAGVGEAERLKQVFGAAPEQVLGSQDQVSTGGKAEFHDAIADWNAASDADGTAPPLPMTVRTAIDRHTRTAERRKLFHGEQVPAGTCFPVTITGDNLAREELELLLAAFEGFNHRTEALPLSLGGGGTSGKGRATWHLDEVRRMGRAAIRRWLARPQPCPWQAHAVADPACRQDLAALREAARQRFAAVAAPAFARAEIEITFDGPFLVRDPTRRRPAAAGEGKDPDALPRLDADGQVLLPGESVKGALRAQAERICRTIRVGLGDADGPVAVLFGDTKRRGRLAVEEFRRIDGRGVASQQFVAIDRFTGGQAHGKLYLFEHADRPVMRGALTLDLADDNGLEPALGLLALLLRDLVEGDITFGLGAAKGYGACRARIVGLSVGGVLPQPLAAGLAGAAARGWPIAGPDLGRLYGDAVNDWVGALHGQGATESPPSPAAAVGGDAATGEPDPGAAGGAGPAAAAGEPDPGAGGGAAPAAATGGGSDVG